MTCPDEPTFIAGGCFTMEYVDRSENPFCEGDESRHTLDVGAAAPVDCET